MSRDIAEIRKRYNLDGGFILFKDMIDGHPNKSYIGIVDSEVLIDEMEISEKDYDYIARREGENKCVRTLPRI